MLTGNALTIGNVMNGALANLNSFLHDLDNGIAAVTAAGGTESAAVLTALKNAIAGPKADLVDYASAYSEANGV